MSKYEILIENKAKGIRYTPVIEGEVTVSWSRQFEAGILTFNVVKDEKIDYQEGNPVALMKDGELIFYGYVWKKSRTKKQIIKTTCYDQLVYFKYKDTYQYKNKSYSDFLKMLCTDRNLTLGEIEETGYKIPARIERNKEFFSMLKTASDLTTTHTGIEYVLFDDKGKICLKKWQSLKIDKAITYNSAVDFDYSTSIEHSYNRIKVNYIDDDSKKVTPFITEDKENIKNWGVLQYYAETNNKENIKEKSEKLLELLNKKNRSLNIKNVFGNWKVRGGSLVPVVFTNIGDISINSMMLVDKVTHTIKKGHHFMDLTVLNKDIQSSVSVDNVFQDKKTKQSNTTKTNNNNSKDAPIEDFKGADNEKLNKMLGYAFAQKGTPYSNKLRMKNGYFDCSSLVLRSMRAAGLDTTGANLSSRSIHSDSRFKQISLNAIKAGDVLWCNGHVALYAGNNKTVEATKSGVKSIVAKGRGTPFTKAYRIKGSG